MFVVSVIFSSGLAPITQHHRIILCSINSFPFYKIISDHNTPNYSTIVNFGKFVTFKIMSKNHMPHVGLSYQTPRPDVQTKKLIIQYSLKHIFSKNHEVTCHGKTVVEMRKILV